ncbi:hypothetical protein QTP88_014550 [Uroleucon formosanum]
MTSNTIVTNKIFICKKRVFIFRSALDTNYNSVGVKCTSIIKLVNLQTAVFIVTVDFKSFNYSKLALYIEVEYTYLSYTYSLNYLNFQVFLCTYTGLTFDNTIQSSANYACKHAALFGFTEFKKDYTLCVQNKDDVIVKNKNESYTMLKYRFPYYYFASYIFVSLCHIGTPSVHYHDQCLRDRIKRLNSTVEHSASLLLIVAITILLLLILISLEQSHAHKL